MNEILQQALSNTTVKILERMAAGESITPAEIEIIKLVCREPKSNPLQSIGELGQTILPLLSMFTGGTT